MKKLSNNFFIVGLCALLLPYLFWFYLAENSYVLIHDCLDHEFVFIKLLLESGNLFGTDLHAVIPNAMNGVPRSAFRTGINFTFLIFSVLPDIYAYITHHLIVHLIGFIGMFLLLQKYFVKDNKVVVLVISYLFAIVPYYHIQYGISISGQPLLLFAFLNLLNNEKKSYNWLIIIGFPFFSFFVATLPFFLPILALIGLVHFKRTKKIPLAFFAAIFVIMVVNVAIEFPLIYSTFFQHEFVSHRSEWNKFEAGSYPSIGGALEDFWKSLNNVHYHAGQLSPLPVIALLIAMLILLGKNIPKMAILLSVLLLCVLVQNCMSDFVLLELFDKIKFLRTFNMERFYFLLPMLWLLLFAVLLDGLSRGNVWQKAAVVCLIFAMYFSIVTRDTEFKNNCNLICNNKIAAPTFKQFYDTDLYSQIKAYIKEAPESYRILNVGVFPNIAQYNGFYTLDSYQNNYSLTYKHEFRKIIAAELEKNNVIKKYFDFWGSRCYTYSSELGKQFYVGKKEDLMISLELNTNQIKAMGGKYIVSALPVHFQPALALTHLKTFNSATSFWELYLYRVN